MILWQRTKRSRKVNEGFSEGNVEKNLEHVADGAAFHAYFFDACRLENGKIKEMRSYLVEKK